MAAISTLTDNFNVAGAIDGAKWSFSNLGVSGSAAQSGGELVLDTVTSVAFNGECQMKSVSSYDLTGSSIYMKVVDATSLTSTTSGTETHFWVEGTGTPANEYLGYFYETNNSNAMYFLGANTPSGNFHTGSTTFSQTTHNWWRIRESAGTIFFDTAANTASNPPLSGDWTNRDSFSTSLLGWTNGITAVKVGISFRLVGTTGAHQTCNLDGVNTSAGTGSATYNDTRTETATATSTATALMAEVASRTEAATITDSSVSGVVQVATITETVTPLTTTQTASFAFAASRTEAATVTDSCDGIKVFGSAVTETLTLTSTTSVSTFWEAIHTDNAASWTLIPTQ